MTALERYDFVADDLIRPFTRDYRVDLLAPDTDQVSSGQYVIFRYRVPKGQVLVVKNFVPYAARRINVGGEDERFEMITPQEGNGYFAFSPLVNSQPLFDSEIDYNAPRKASGTLTNKDRQKRSGISAISLNPWAEAQQNPPTYFGIKVNSDTELTATFEVLPAASANPLTNGVFEIGQAVPMNRRVDFAGVVVAGVVMSQSAYDRLVQPPPAPSSGGGSGGSGGMGSFGPACG